jgi:beta-1,4-mannosyl-glycoprotein beta-1,4-N-acetylglucosaminyltransferase
MYPNDSRSDVHYIPHTAGWHCSWCFRPENIVIKLTSAINADFPRWDNYPEKLNLTYIRENIQLGRWFDGNSVGTKNMAVLGQQNRATFALKYFIDNEKKFDYLLKNIYL